jgi:ribosome-binding protein aMBF1 (putative translation factor)
MARTKNFSEVIRKKLVGDKKLAIRVARQSLNYSLAEEIHRARQEVGMTQSQLAQAIGTQQSVIARLEDADYQGHTVTMLRKISSAIGMELQIKFIPSRNRKPVALKSSARKSARSLKNRSA